VSVELFTAVALTAATNYCIGTSANWPLSVMIKTQEITDILNNDCKRRIVSARNIGFRVRFNRITISVRVSCRSTVSAKSFEDVVDF